MVYGSWFLIGLWVVVFGSWFMSPVQATSTPLPEDATGTVEPPENKINPILVTLQVIIPGFDPSDVIVIGNGENGCKLGYTCVRTITNYLNAIYKWGVGAGAIFAIVLIMIGGVEWMIGSAVGTIERAKTRIKNASLGLLLLRGARPLEFGIVVCICRSRRPLLRQPLLGGKTGDMLQGCLQWRVRVGFW